MEREIINFTEEQTRWFDEDSMPDGFEWIDEYQISFDTEKGSIENNVIIKRLSDNKYFKGIVFKGYAGYHETRQTFIETFPEQLTVTVYN